MVVEEEEMVLLVASAAGRLGHQLPSSTSGELCWSPSPSPLLLLLHCNPPTPPATRSQAAAQTSRSRNHEGDRPHPGRPVWQPDRSQGKTSKPSSQCLQTVFLAPVLRFPSCKLCAAACATVGFAGLARHAQQGRGPRGCSRPFLKFEKFAETIILAEYQSILIGGMFFLSKFVSL